MRQCLQCGTEFTPGVDGVGWWCPDCGADNSTDVYTKEGFRVI